MKVITTILLVAALATGCATHGTWFEATAADNLQPGVTTVEDATAALGKPYSMSDMGQKGKLYQWIYVSPAGSRHLAILFRPDGKMERITHRKD